MYTLFSAALLKNAEYTKSRDHISWLNNYTINILAFLNRFYSSSYAVKLVLSFLISFLSCASRNSGL